MPIISDPDQLVDGVDVVVNTTAKTIKIQPYNASTNASGVVDDEGATGGVTGQTLYSWLKEEWKTNTTYIKFPFPMEAITPESFEFINGWKPADDATRKLIRTAGWAERTAAGVVERQYLGVVSLGSLGATDQPYYQFNTGAAVNFTYPGPVNEAVQIFGDASNGNFNYTDGDSFKLFCREQGKLYASSNNTAIGAPTLTYITYRFPLSNATDLKISSSDAFITKSVAITSASWTGGVATINTTTAHGFSSGQYAKITGVTPSGYNVGGVVTVIDTDTFTVNVVSDPGAYSTGGTVGSIHSTISVEYFGTDQLFDVDGDTTDEPYRYVITDASGSATTQQIYEKIQYLLRQNSDIDAGAGSVTGKTADALLAFVGDTLVGANGVFISGLSANFLNAVDFYDFNGIVRRYPFVAAGTINFGTFAGSGDFIYRMFFTTTPNGSNYGETDALIVNDKNGTPISGTYTGAPVDWTFNYDSNTQGGRTVSPPGNVNVKVVGIGLLGGQFASVDHVITRTAGQSILLAPAQERNYSNPV